MPRYFFHLVTSRLTVRDVLGRDLPNNDAAREHAIRRIKDMLDGKTGKVLNPSTSVVTATDKDGNLYLRVSFSEVLRHLPP
jgi:hypothetical protein